MTNISIKNRIFYWLAEFSESFIAFNLFRYITVRAGAAFFTAGAAFLASALASFFGASQAVAMAPPSRRGRIPVRIVRRCT